MANLYAYDPSAPSIAEAFRKYFKVGAAINSWNLRKDSTEYAVLAKQFDVFTLENESKPEPTHPEPDRFVFDGVDRFAAFGEETGKTLRGHTLVWHSQCPMWLFFDENKELVTEEVLIRRMKEHIRAVMGRYKGKIAVWDVVNEVIRDEGGMRESLWYKIAGTNYIKEAFRTAREVDPSARLIINDYNLESSDAKADTMAAFVGEMIEEGVPVDGIGLQMHLNLFDTDMEKLRRNVRKFTALRKIKPDLMLEVTELDMSCYRWADENTDVLWTDELHEQFSAKYTELFRFYMELAEEGVLDSVVFWGLDDGHSWLNGFPRRHKNYPLLIGRDFEVKKAFFDVIALTEEK